MSLHNTLILFYLTWKNVKYDYVGTKIGTTIFNHQLLIPSLIFTKTNKLWRVSI